MVSKKEMLMVGMLAIGGIGLASMLPDDKTEAPPQGLRNVFLPQAPQGTIEPVYRDSNITYNIKQADVKFPSPGAFDISKFLQTPATITPVKKTPSSSGGSVHRGYGESFAAAESIPIGGGGGVHRGYGESFAAAESIPFRSYGGGGSGGGRVSTPSTPSSTPSSTPTSKKSSTPRSFGFTARNIGGGWSTGY